MSKAQGMGLSLVAAEVGQYVSNIKSFERSDWLRYLAWMSTVMSLFFGTTAFVLWGHAHGVVFPGYVWFIPIGSGMFACALALDDIGHRTMYKDDLRRGEGSVHQMIVATAVPSVVALCLCYEHPETFRMPALGLIFLSFFYSAIDEAMHWFRYMTKKFDRVEMWSHFVAITGHVVMIACWWEWFDSGYPGVYETFRHIPFIGYWP
jgi:hypothetical protein